ncbi:mitochondrial carrier [Sistotremastrum niveocremeum HHB9708]|uniref:Mitochondrial carrier n=1 Tax=Sistotremastrum niveocremeum HHB9708 TaxID=1314777 RepID=A0A164Z5C8_9AGAM|nr:mitochondrial carrier [Sistotremastrum niveocremeum HHB9708]
MSSDSLIHALAGALGGIAAMSATYPLIFLSTRAAVETKKENKTTYEAVHDIITREGLTGLYSGLGSSLIGIAVTQGAYYFFYERTRASILDRKSGSKALSTLESMLAGLVAGSATAVISNPVWVIQTSQAVQTMEPSDSAGESASSKRATVIKKLGIWETIQHILSKGGLPAFWRGIGPALVLVTNPVLQYTVFEQLKNLLVLRRTAKLRAAGQRGPGTLTDIDFFFLGAISKLGKLRWSVYSLQHIFTLDSVATSITYPYIVIKSRLQAGHSSALRYKSALDGILTVIQEEGISGVYKGVGNKLIQSVLTAAILFVGQKRIYEMTKKALAPVLIK